MKTSSFYDRVASSAAQGGVAAVINAGLGNYRFMQSMDTPITKEGLWKAYLPTLFRDILYSISRANVGAYVRKTFPKWQEHAAGRFFSMFITALISCIVSSPGNELRGYFLQQSVAKGKKKKGDADDEKGGELENKGRGRANPTIGSQQSAAKGTKKRDADDEKGGGHANPTIDFKTFFKPQKYIRSTAVGATNIALSLGTGALIVEPLERFLTKLRRKIESHSVVAVIVALFLLHHYIESRKTNKVRQRVDNMLRKMGIAIKERFAAARRSGSPSLKIEKERRRNERASGEREDEERVQAETDSDGSVVVVEKGGGGVAGHDEPVGTATAASPFSSPSKSLATESDGGAADVDRILDSIAVPPTPLREGP
eukprot:g1942.t1